MNTWNKWKENNKKKKYEKKSKNDKTKLWLRA